MHKALVLVLTQDTKKGMVPDNAAGGKNPVSQLNSMLRNLACRLTDVI